MAQSLWKTLRQFLIELITLVPYELAIVLLGIYPNELKFYVHTKICTRMSPAASFIVAKTRKQATCPSVDDWVNCGAWTMDYYSALK